jgi:hypothetical protein
MTEGLMPEEAWPLLGPEHVTPALLYLVCEDSPNRTILAAGAGSFAVAKIYETDGINIPVAELSPEAVRDNFAAIADTSNQKELVAGFEQSAKFIEKAVANLKQDG